MMKEAGLKNFFYFFTQSFLLQLRVVPSVFLIGDNILVHKDVKARANDDDVYTYVHTYFYDGSSLVRISNLPFNFRSKLKQTPSI